MTLSPLLSWSFCSSTCRSQPNASTLPAFGQQCGYNPPGVKALPGRSFFLDPSPLRVEAAAQTSAPAVPAAAVAPATAFSPAAPAASPPVQLHLAAGLAGAGLRPRPPRVPLRLPSSVSSPATGSRGARFQPTCPIPARSGFRRTRGPPPLPSSLRSGSRGTH
ncbi:WAS/WASL-interacting protein family member 2-like [Fundulus heteroclitus]|uniref:WAS/WASL-interacting protein family member 2-like n=1 Tax=Fundulus heteroclitus TaxID=8078 RepID=UPI00165A69EF|nr:WAS/WASL-interacting protein family member 2-like [Fundulus heteroclitus]